MVIISENQKKINIIEKKYDKRQSKSKKHEQSQRKLKKRKGLSGFKVINLTLNAKNPEYPIKVQHFKSPQVLPKIRATPQQLKSPGFLKAPLNQLKQEKFSKPLQSLFSKPNLQKVIAPKIDFHSNICIDQIKPLQKVCAPKRSIFSQTSL